MFSLILKLCAAIDFVFNNVCVYKSVKLKQFAEKQTSVVHIQVMITRLH